MSDATERRFGDTWRGHDGRAYVAVVARHPDRGQVIVPMLVATGAIRTYLPPEVVKKLGGDLEIGVRSETGRIEWVKPNLDPSSLPRHENDQGGVLGLDILMKIRAVVGGERMFVVR